MLSYKKDFAMSIEFNDYDATPEIKKPSIFSRLFLLGGLFYVSIFNV